LFHVKRQSDCPPVTVRATDDFSQPPACPAILCRRWASARRTAAAWILRCSPTAKQIQRKQESRLVKLEFLNLLRNHVSQGWRRKFTQSGPRIRSAWNKCSRSSPECLRGSVVEDPPVETFRSSHSGNRCQPHRTAMTRGRFLPLQLPVDTKLSVEHQML
jgi:hypothetical protein